MPRRGIVCCNKNKYSFKTKNKKMGNKPTKAEDGRCKMCDVIPIEKNLNQTDGSDDLVTMLANRPLNRPHKMFGNSDMTACSQFHNSQGKTIAVIIPTTSSNFIPNLPVIAVPSDLLVKTKNSKDARDILDKTCPVGQILNGETGQCEGIVTLTRSGMPLLDVPSRPAVPFLVQTQKKVAQTRSEKKKKTKKEETDGHETWISSSD
jgi:hypothetical protein